METDNKKRIATARNKLLRALRSMGAEVEPIVTISAFGHRINEVMFSINGVPTYLHIDAIGRFAAPAAPLKITFGANPSRSSGPRLSLREPKAGFDFKTLAYRVIGWTDEEQSRLDEQARIGKIQAINQSLANKLNRIYQKEKKLPVRFHSFEREQSPVVDVDVHLHSVTETLAVRVTKAVEKALGTKALQRKP